jgi:hypothetical protein
MISQTPLNYQELGQLSTLSLPMQADPRSAVLSYRLSLLSSPLASHLHNRWLGCIAKELACALQIHMDIETVFRLALFLLNILLAARKVSDV